MEIMEVDKGIVKRSRQKTAYNGIPSLLEILIIVAVVLFIYFPTWAFLFAYFAARLFIVVEVFIALRSVPVGVYQTP